VNRRTDADGQAEIGTALPPRPPVGQIGLRRRLLEARAPLEALAFFGLQPLLRLTHLTGERHTVLVLPGGMSDDKATVFLRWALRAQGYDAHGWGLGMNMGPNEEVLAGMHARVRELYREHDSKITLIGWSLGGIYARMLARDLPDLVRRVITLGSPFRMIEADDFAPFGRARWDRFVEEHAEDVDLMRTHEHDRPPITVPTTAIYSRTDGMAPWQLSIDEVGPHAPNPRAENVEVRGSHIGLASNPSVAVVIFDRLAQPEDAWSPFRPIPALAHFYPPPATWIHPVHHPVRLRKSRGRP
jgi:pimeloyl-ACP methyl ester carboxylesterase